MFQINHLIAHSLVQQRQDHHRSVAAVHRLVRADDPPERRPRRFAPFGRGRRVSALALR
jgi:hypothetical protein